MRIRRPRPNRFRPQPGTATYVVHADGTVTVLGFGPGITIDEGV